MTIALPDLPPPEFSRLFDLRQAEGREVVLDARPAEKAALAVRFGLIRIDRLRAELLLERQGGTVSATGHLAASIVQACAISAEDLPVTIAEPITFRFVPMRADHRPDEEIELDAHDCDEIEYVGTTFDLGEAVAQSLALAIDPFACGPDAESARAAAGLGLPDESGPFAALALLKTKN